METRATSIVRGALDGSGVDLVASCPIATYDARAPPDFRSSSLLPGARGLIVVGSAGRTLWRRFRAHFEATPPCCDDAHPLDHFVASILARADSDLARAQVRFRRFDATVDADPRLDFVAMGELVGLGSRGPFGMLIHSQHGAWWALRGAWLVDAEVEGPIAHLPPCAGCPAPCVGGWANAGGVARATVQARARCVVGQTFRYDEDQIAYHYDREATVARLRLRSSPES